MSSIELTSTQCGINPVCVVIELSSILWTCIDPGCVVLELTSTQCGIDPVCVLIALTPTQCGMDPVCVLIELTPTQCGINPVCVLIELTSTQCSMDPVCVLIELPQPSVVWIQCAFRFFFRKKFQGGQTNVSRNRGGGGGHRLELKYIMYLLQVPL